MSRLGVLFSDDDDYLDDDERKRRTAAKIGELDTRRLTPDWFRRQQDLCIPPLRVAIVGGGFAGLAAAWYLKACGVQVTVYEASARLGGRVRSDRTFIPGKVVEAGAELIGENHPLWNYLAQKFGLPLVPLTTEKAYRNAGLLVRTRFGNHDLTPTEETQLETALATAFAAIGQDANPISEETPWLSRNAGRYDSMSVADKLDVLLGRATTLARTWFEFTLGNDNCAAISDQSYLGLLASVSAARMGSDPRGMLGYWLSTETHRCGGGNDLLSERLRAYITDTNIKLQSSVDGILLQPSCYPPVVIRYAQRDAQGAVIGHRFGSHDYAILAAPPTVWNAITFSPTFPAAARTLQHGPAVKFLTRYATAFWLQAQPALAPVTKWNQLGSVWEGTDKQPPTPGYGLSVFSGGPIIQPRTTYSPQLTRLYPTRTVTINPPSEQYIDWPSTPFIMTGYAVPARGQASTIHPTQLQPHQGRLYFAGEQTSHGFFGYMEGALQSGARAARDIILTVARPCPQPMYWAGPTPDPRDAGDRPGGTDEPPGSGYSGGGGQSGGGGSSDEY